MTVELELYLKENKKLIEEEDLHTLYKRCPINRKKELCLLLLECSDNDITLFPQDYSTKIIETEVKKYIPECNICYCWIGFDKLNSLDNSRSGSLSYVAVVNNKVVEGRYRYNVKVDFFDVHTLISSCGKDFAQHIHSKQNEE